MAFTKYSLRPNQNTNLKQAWSALGHTGVFTGNSPFRDATKPGNKMIIPSDTPDVRICLPLALTGTCYDNCKGKHGPLSEAEVKRVATAGGMTVDS